MNRRLKFYVSLIMCFVLAFNMSACKKNNSKPVESATVLYKSPEDVKKDYAYILRVTINPDMLLYVDASNKVLYVEAVNDDAKKLISNISIVGTDVEKAVLDITKEAVSEGFVKDGADISLRIEESKIKIEDAQGAVNRVDEKIEESGILKDTHAHVRIEEPVDQGNHEEHKNLTVVKEEDWEKYAPPNYDMAVVIKHVVSYLAYINAERQTVIIAYPLDDKYMDDYEGICINDRLYSDGLYDFISVPYNHGHMKDVVPVEIKVLSSHIGQKGTDETISHMREAIASAAKRSGAKVDIRENLSVASIDETKVAEYNEQSNDDHTHNDEGHEGHEHHEDQGTSHPDGYIEEREGYHKCTACGTSGVCDRCGGTGKMVDDYCSNGYLDCSQCNGEGRMRCSCGDGKCWHCHGDGYLPCELCHGSDQNCMACHGTNKVKCNSCTRGECMQCDGTLYTGICDKCNGTGKNECNICHGTGIRLCLACEGSGVCIWCKGEGYVKND